MGLRRTLMTMAAGAALAYFLDPEKGEQRRAQLRQQVDDLLQQGSSRVQELRNSASNGMYGSPDERLSAGTHPSDATLTR